MLKILIFFLSFGVLAAFADETKTECQEHREREQKSSSNLPTGVIPECDENGDYKPLQCFQNSKFCACWTKDGQPITQPSGNIRACDCLINHYQLKGKKLVGSFLPDCEEDGKYKKYGCHASTATCYCIDTETGKRKGTANSEDECK